jgi:hypothetical protein
MIALSGTFSQGENAVMQDTSAPAGRYDVYATNPAVLTAVL